MFGERRRECERKKKQGGEGVFLDVGLKDGLLEGRVGSIKVVVDDEGVDGQSVCRFDLPRCLLEPLCDRLL